MKTKNKYPMGAGSMPMTPDEEQRDEVARAKATSVRMSTYFKGPSEFHVLSRELATIITVLNKGRTGGLGGAAVHASAKGYRITFCGRTVCTGKTPAELQANFRAAVDKAVAESEEKGSTP